MRGELARVGAGPDRDPFVRVTLPPGEAGPRERHVVGVHQQVLVGRPVQQPASAERRPPGVVIPRRSPPRVAQLQPVVERAADAEQPLALALQQDRRVARGMAGSVDGADTRKDPGIVLERPQPAAEDPDRLAGRLPVLVIPRPGGVGAERDLGRVREAGRLSKRQMRGP
jgi:hypothetical protein